VGAALRIDRHIALIVGDTAGHFYPALAVAQAYQRRYERVDVRFMGPSGIGADLAGRHAVPFQPIDGSPLVRVGLARKIAAAGRAAHGVTQARRVLQAHGTRLALGFGGFASGGALIAARSLGLCVAIHEANAWPGVANRLLGRVADRIYIAFPAAQDHFPPARQLRTGWPIRAELANIAERRRSRARRPARVLVVGGSRGCEFFDREVPWLLGRVAASNAVRAVHQTSATNRDEVIGSYARAGVAATVTPFIEDIASAYAEADFVIARAGGGTIAEVAAAGLPSLLVPLPDAAEQHQHANAGAFATAGAGLCVMEHEWSVEALAERVGHMLCDGEAWDAASHCARTFGMPDAADRVVDDCEVMMRGRW